MKKDNSTFKQKAALRISLLEEIENPVILETHGGNGVLYLACYQQFPEGCVIEKNGVKADLLAAQRPTWSVYEGDSLRAIEAGAGSHLKVNLLDLDPYGEP